MDSILKAVLTLSASVNAKTTRLCYITMLLISLVSVHVLKTYMLISANRCVWQHVLRFHPILAMMLTILACQDALMAILLINQREGVSKLVL